MYRLTVPTYLHGSRKNRREGAWAEKNEVPNWFEDHLVKLAHLADAGLLCDRTSAFRLHAGLHSRHSLLATSWLLSAIGHVRKPNKLREVSVKVFYRIDPQTLVFRMPTVPAAVLRMALSQSWMRVVGSNRQTAFQMVYEHSNYKKDAPCLETYPGRVGVASRPRANFQNGPFGPRLNSSINV